MKLKRIKGPVNLLYLIAFLGIILLQSCSEEEKEPAKSMEQIRKEEGVPVRIKTIEVQNFTKNLNLYATLSGIKETTKRAPTGDKISKLNAKAGDYVKEDQVIVEYPTDNPALQYEQAKIAYENSELTYKRMKALLEAGETAQQNLDNVKAQYLVNKRNFESMKQILFVESPISGNIIKMDLKVGDHIKSGDPLFTVAQLGTMKAKAWASKDEAAQIKVGMPAIIIDGDTEFKGRVSEVTLAMDSKKRAFGIEMQFPNPGKKLKSGVIADVRIDIYKNQEAIVVPRNLIKEDPEGMYVYVENGGEAVKKYITFTNQSNIDFEINSGLNIGDRLITEGLSLISDGIKVKVVE